MRRGSSSPDVPADRLRRRTVALRREYTDTPHRGPLIWRLLYPEGVDRPRHRGDCVNEDAVRPCPFVGCRHHLYLEAQGQTLRVPSCDPWDLHPSCSLDLADAGPLSLDAVGAVLGVTGERARQLIEGALARARVVLEEMGVHG